MVQKVCLFLLVLTVASARSDRRQDAGTLKKESGLKSWKRAPRWDVFENLFNVYDPSFLSGVWPKITNGVHLTLETACWDDMKIFFKDLAEGRAWAYDAVDASGRYQSALFSGSRFWLGSKDECLRLDDNFQTEIDNETLALLRNNDYLNSVLRRQKYFDAEINDWRWMVQRDELLDQLVSADHRPPFRMVYTTLQLQLNISKITMVKSYDVTLGVCLPQSCPRDDVESIVNFSIMLNDNLKSNRTTPRTVKITSSRRIHGEFRIENDAGVILLITVTLFLVLLATVATLVDFDLLKCVRYKKQSMSFDLPTYNSSETKLVEESKRKHSEIKSVDDMLVDSGNLDLVSMSKIPRSLAPPVITLDVLNAERLSGSCNRCGKYKRQCPNVQPPCNLQPCPRLKYSSFASLSTADRRKNNFFCRLLLCFSLCYSWKRIFNKNTANKDLSLVHMMRILSTFWIIYVHVAVMVRYISDDDNMNDNDNLYSIIAFGTIAFDTLFFVSGLFSAHHFFYLKSRYSVEELVSFGGACGQFMQFVCFVTNRVIRLVPSYLYAILVAGVAARAARGSPLVLPDSDHYACDQHWWRNVLYITNFYPQDQQISWYLTVETQLHAAGALVCAGGAAGGARARLALAAATTLVIAATVADVSAAYFDLDIQYSSTYSAYSVLVSRGWARAAPYAAGAAVGWLVHAMRGRLHLTTLTSFLLWSLSLPLAGGAWWAARAQIPWAAAWQHLAWPFALLWPVLAATTRYAGRFQATSCSAGAALSRLSYSMLLLHGAAARLLLAATGAPLCSKTACIWMYFTGTAAVSIAGALALSLLLEMPCCGLFRRLSDAAADSRT